MAIDLRQAGPGDAEALMPLIQEHALFERQHATCRPELLRSALSGEYPSLLGWVAERDNQLLGYATATLDFSTWSARPFMHLDCLFVTATERGFGLGGCLLQQVTDYCLAKGYCRLEWQTPTWNEPAVRFYERTGATSLPKLRFSLVMPFSGQSERALETHD